MNLSTCLADAFAPDVQRRGHSFYRAGYIRLVAGTPWMVQAYVQGGSGYQVTLAREEVLISGSCTCPYADFHGEPCTHLWATVLAADANNYLLEDKTPQTLSFRLYRASGTNEDFPEDGAQDEVMPDPLRRRMYGLRLPQGGHSQGQQTPRHQAVSPPAPVTPWKHALNTIHTAASQQGQRQEPWPATRQVFYMVDVPGTRSSGRVLLELAMRERRKSDGAWGKVKTIRLTGSQVECLPAALDRHILTTLLGAREHYGYSDASHNPYAYSTVATRYHLSDALQQVLVPLMCQTGHCCLRLSPTATEFPVLLWDDSPPWQFSLHMQRQEEQQQYAVTGRLQRQGDHGVEHISMAEAMLLTAGGLLFTQERVVRFEHHGAFAWIPYLRQHGNITIPFAQAQTFLSDFFTLSQFPRLEVPPELHYEEVNVVPQPKIVLRPLKQPGWSDRVSGEIMFLYGEQRVSPGNAHGGVYDQTSRRLLVRHPASEQQALETLQQLGFKEQRYSFEPHPMLTLSASRVPRVVRQLTESGWVVEAAGKLYRRPGAFRLNVSSGIDWFELHGTIEFDDLTASLPAVLAALQHGDNTVRLDDGTYGVLPEEWLKRYGILAGFGTPHSDHMRFSTAQTGLLDALLAAQPEATCDAAFAQARQQLTGFQGIVPADPPAVFHGTLRAYQREGLGWLHFLRQFGFGGCLADDMGLGKTVQVLALLASRRLPAAAAESNQGQRPAPSLVVVPKSLVFNWQQEAARFAPHLRILDHTGQGRKKGQVEHFDAYDVILTTYGTLRNDAVLFKDVRFDYVILDEAQAIKNANTESAKAARLLQGDYKLALSGTPIENHLGELWSLCEFLNPGMLGSAAVFAASSGAGRTLDADTRQLLAQALRPFILRRTKAQVAQDLPPKIEQTIFCELEPPQRKLYNALRDHYRQSLLSTVTAEGLNTSKIIILEALLRLRQVACHPGLLEAAKNSESSAKLDVLLPKLVEAMEGGHKTLVFSQFTSFLAIVRARLDHEGITYEYLDGRTRNRQERVERFQTDPACQLFLISLKAGGLGLNLTAADNVFLLDPWWNPAVEAQAIDRTHRIGQTKQVFACRLIAKDTVEEKVLELQNTKRDLADAILTANNSLIRNLKREDLELLLS